jgi:hypothetical protein
MKLKTFIVFGVAIAFLFVLSTQDLYAAHKAQNVAKEAAKNATSVESDIQLELLKADVILGNEDGGGYYRYDLTWLWITLAIILIIALVVILTYNESWWWWY